MAKCGVCKESGHTAVRHDVPCRICGSIKQFPIEEAKQMKEVYRCGDLNAHEKARNIWGLDYEAAQRVRRHVIHERPIGKGK